MSIIKSLKKNIEKLRFRFKAAEYMRVSYLDPRSVVLITSRYEDKDNVMPIDWHIPLSYSPKLYGISLEKKNYSYELIMKSNVFAVNFMGSEFEKQILETGRMSGSGTDKYELTGLKKINGKTLNVPVLEDSLGYIECKVKQTVEAGDHVLIIGDVKYENFKRLDTKQMYHETKA